VIALDVPRCSDCGRPTPVAMTSADGRLRYCADCVDWQSVIRLASAPPRRGK
jgi:recombinational DNA repair protein (RecF pathway)